MTCCVRPIELCEKNGLCSVESGTMNNLTKIEERDTNWIEASFHQERQNNSVLATRDGRSHFCSAGNRRARSVDSAKIIIQSAPVRKCRGQCSVRRGHSSVDGATASVES